MNDLGDDSGSSVARFLGRVADGVWRSRAYNRPGDGASLANGALSHIAQSEDAAAARRAAYEKGDPGNIVLEFETVEFDPRADIICDPLERLGVGYSVEYANGLATFEANRLAAPVMARLADFYIGEGHIPPKRFQNLADVRAAACAVSRSYQVPSAQNRKPAHAVSAHEEDLGPTVDYKSLVVEDKESYELLRGVYADAGVKHYAEWSADEGQGYFVLEGAEFERGEKAVEQALAEIESGAKTRDQIARPLPEISAEEAEERVSLEFVTVERDREAAIITNALARAGVVDWTVTAPEPDGKVAVSVLREDAPHLVQIAESYVESGTVEAGRFANLDDLKRREDALRAAERTAYKHSRKSPAKADENAKRSAELRNREHGVQPPTRTQAR